jgi:glucose/mannose-6-phosphate isomerase
MSSILDQPDYCASIDPLSMRGLIQGFPDQVRDAAQRALLVSLPPPDDVANIVITGLGGSAIGGDVVGTVVAESLRVPLIVNRDYRLPGFVSRVSVVFASSYSGNTEETLSAFGQAYDSGAYLVCFSSGGKLADAAHQRRLPLIRLPGGFPPRAALGYSSIAMLAALQSLGLIPDQASALSETVGVLESMSERIGPAVEESRNPAKSLARSLHGKIVAIYGSNSPLAPAAARWRGQIEENAKNLALHHLLPEMNHNELVGWECPDACLRSVAAVFLRDQGEHPQVRQRFELTREIVKRAAGMVQDVWSEGTSLLARLFSVIYFGDFVSLYLSYLNGKDPVPVHVIEYLKRELGEGAVQEGGTSSDS